MTGSAGQAKGSDPMPKMSKPSSTGEQPHPLKDKLVGEEDIDTMSLTPGITALGGALDPDDDFSAFLGDENESMLSAALNYRSGAGLCPSQDLGMGGTKKGRRFARVATSPAGDTLIKPNSPGRIAIDLNAQ